MKPLPDYHYRESEEDFLERTLGKDPREIEDRADEKYHQRKDDESCKDYEEEEENGT